MSSENDGNEKREFVEGDIVYYEIVQGEGVYSVGKVLKVETWNGQKTFHMLSYVTINHLPTLDEVPNLPVAIWHSPIASLAGEQFLGNIPVEERELEGFYTYLKMTDLDRYYKETNQDMDEVIEKALEKYREANDLCEEGKYEEALDLYDEAIDLFPLFWEAIDNRGLTYMDLGQWNYAIEDFKLSIKIQPGEIIAVFSLGECLFKKGDYEAALKYFQMAHEIDPNDPIPLEWIEKVRIFLDVD